MALIPRKRMSSDLLDPKPREGSFNGVTSDGVFKATGEAIDNILDDGSASETVVVAIPSSQSSNYTVGNYYEVQGKVSRLRTKTDGDNVTQLTFYTTSGVLDAMNGIVEDVGNIGKPLIPIGTATVSYLNGTIEGLKSGWMYTLTDSGTLTAGSVEVEPGDEVAWGANNEWFKVGSESSKIAVFEGMFNPSVQPVDYSGLPDQADVRAAINAGKDVVLMLKPTSSAPYLPWRLVQAYEYGIVFVKYGVPEVTAEGLIEYDTLYLSYGGPGNPWNWGGYSSKLGKVATFTYLDSYRPALSAMQAARDANKAVIMVLGEDVQVGGTSVAPRTYTLEKGTVMTLVFDTGRKGYGDHSFEFNCFGHFGSSGEYGNSSGLVMVEAIVKDGGGGDEWEWNIRFDESLGGLGNWNDSIIKQYTPYRGKMVQLVLNGRTLGLLPTSAANQLEREGLAPSNQRAQAICWGSYNSEIGYVNMPKFQSVNGPFSINGGTSFMDVDFIEMDNLSRFVGLYLYNIKSDDEGPGGTPIHESRCVFTPYAFAQPWQPNTEYRADSSVVWVNGMPYLCKTTHMSGGTWDTTELANWTDKTWLQYLQDNIGAVKNGGSVPQSSGYVFVNNNSVTTITGVNVSALEVTVILANGTGEVPNFAFEIEPTVNCTLTIKRYDTSATLSPSVAGGNVMTGGKKYQVTCVGSCWTLAEFTVPTP